MVVKRRRRAKKQASRDAQANGNEAPNSRIEEETPFVPPPSGAAPPASAVSPPNQSNFDDIGTLLDADEVQSHRAAACFHRSVRCVPVALDHFQTRE